MYPSVVFAEWVTPALWEKLLGEFPVLVTFCILWSYFLHHLTKQHERLIKTKNDEIERLVQQRNFYQNIVHGRRLSTTPETTQANQGELNNAPDEEREQERAGQTVERDKTNPKGRGKKKKHD